jgi:hypothetical protein
VIAEILAASEGAFEDLTFLGAMATAVLVLGIMNAIHAIMNVRLYQSAIAWTCTRRSSWWTTRSPAWVR